MDVVASTLTTLGFMLYAGPMVVFTVLICLGPRFGRPIQDSIRSYRGWGPVLGLALGACILGGLGGIWLEENTFAWSCETPTERLRSLTHGLFFCAWVSNIKLEIWTLDPLRKLDADSDSSAYGLAARRLGRHMVVQSALLLAVAVLGTMRHSS